MCVCVQYWWRVSAAAEVAVILLLYVANNLLNAIAKTNISECSSLIIPDSRDTRSKPVRWIHQYVASIGHRVLITPKRKTYSMQLLTYIRTVISGLLLGQQKDQTIYKDTKKGVIAL